MNYSRGMTLVEVLTGLVLLSTLLVAMITARGRYLKQWGHADKRVEAVERADALLSAWWQDLETFPKTGCGPISGTRGWRWRTRVVKSEEATKLNSTIVRLEIHTEDHSRNHRPVSVDVLVPNEDQQ